eukprot:scaffold49071_cov59-Phaeocystis_antarctica.AAC.10
MNASSLYSPSTHHYPLSLTTYLGVVVQPHGMERRLVTFEHRAAKDEADPRGGRPKYVSR